MLYFLRELGGPRLIRCYGNLYSQGRVEALKALDSLPQLKDSSELKSKILFSVVVVSNHSKKLKESLTMKLMREGYLVTFHKIKKKKPVKYHLIYSYSYSSVFFCFVNFWHTVGKQSHYESEHD